MHTNLSWLRTHYLVWSFLENLCLMILKGMIAEAIINTKQTMITVMIMDVFLVLEPVYTRNGKWIKAGTNVVIHPTPGP